MHVYVLYNHQSYFMVHAFLRGREEKHLLILHISAFKRLEMYFFIEIFEQVLKTWLISWQPKQFTF